MKISKLARRAAKKLFRVCFVNGVLDEERVRQVVARVLQTKPRAYLAIASHLLRLSKLEIERRTARVESAMPLAGDLRGEVQNTLTRVYGPGLRISFAENPALIGGIRVKVGSDVYDGSIQGRLAALEQSF
jgi:F-type H+-transporting ATPase subunit delta